MLMAAASPISFATWQALIDNFAIHCAAFTGQEIGILQSLREVPGFLSFAVVFTAYAVVDTAWVAATLYVVDHMFFALAIAIRTYFQKIADPADIASTAGVSFTINHIAAVVLPAVYGLLWLVSPELVFLSGAALALISLICALLVPRDPALGNEVMTFEMTSAKSAMR